MCGSGVRPPVRQLSRPLPLADCFSCDIQCEENWPVGEKAILSWASFNCPGKEKRRPYISSCSVSTLLKVNRLCESSRRAHCLAPRSGQREVMRPAAGLPSDVLASSPPGTGPLSYILIWHPREQFIWERVPLRTHTRSTTKTTFGAWGVRPIMKEKCKPKVFSIQHWIDGDQDH